MQAFLCSFFFFWNDAPCSSRFCFLAMTEISRPLSFVYAYTRPQSIQKQIVECDIKSKYLEEYSTVDKVGRERLLELIAYSFLI